MRVPARGADGAALSTGSRALLTFVDVASGAVRSEQEVLLAAAFVAQILPYFDQYALSHTFWSRDSRYLLLPLVTWSGQDQLTIVPADGSAPVTIAEGSRGSWIP